MSKKGILLVNLGTPDSPSRPDVRKYLNEFLMDKRVIDLHPVWRTILVKCFIVPFRSGRSAKLYQLIWREKDASPLLYYSNLQRQALQDRLGEKYQVELGMRYQNPSIENALKRLRTANVDSIRVIPLFPQYASASSGSVVNKVMDILKEWPSIPDISFVNSFYDDNAMIECFAENGRKYQPDDYDHVLFSFHGLPQRQLIKSDHGQGHCLKVANCCETLTETNKSCYAAQAYYTGQQIAKQLNIPLEKYTVCFQSRLGTTPWMQPYTSEVISKLARDGKKRVLIFCPAFVADCLETIYEIQVEYKEQFIKEGGEKIQLVESLNNSAKWIESLAVLASS